MWPISHARLIGASSVLIFAALLLSSQLALAQFTQQGPKLVGSFTDFGSQPPQTPGQQGWSVALSGDGNTAIVGGPTQVESPMMAVLPSPDSPTEKPCTAVGVPTVPAPMRKARLRRKAARPGARSTGHWSATGHQRRLHPRKEACLFRRGTIVKAFRGPRRSAKHCATRAGSYVKAYG
jgi:hypothetical protein